MRKSKSNNSKIFRCETSYNDPSVFQAIFAILQSETSNTKPSTAPQRYTLYCFYMKLFVIANITNVDPSYIREQRLARTLQEDLTNHREARHLAVTLLNTLVLPKQSDNDEPELQAMAQEILQNLSIKAKLYLYYSLAVLLTYPIANAKCANPKNLASLLYAIFHYHQTDFRDRIVTKSAAMLLNRCDEYLLAAYEPVVLAAFTVLQVLPVRQLQAVRYDRLIDCIVELAGPATATGIRLAVANFIVRSDSFLSAATGRWKNFLHTNSTPTGGMEVLSKVTITKFLGPQSLLVSCIVFFSFAQSSVFR